MPMDRRGFLIALGASAATVSVGTQLVGFTGIVPAGAQGAALDPYRELVTNGSFESGPLGAAIEGWGQVV